jgi:hypothetical protein
LTGRAATSARAESETLHRHVEVSSIVQIEAIDFDSASRVTSALMASVKGRPETDDPLRIDTIYDKERARLKVIVTGGIGMTASLLKFINACLEA